MTKISTTLNLYTSPTTPTVGGIISLTAFVIPTSSGNCTGTVSFSNSTVIAIVPIVDNTARLTVDLSQYTAATNSLVATYSGDNTYATSSNTKSVPIAAAISANGVWYQDTANNTGAFDYTKEFKNMAASLETIAVNCSEIRNYIGDISKSCSPIPTIANLASGNGIHTTGAYDWIGAVSLLNYYVNQGAILDTTNNVSSANQANAAVSLASYNKTVVRNTSTYFSTNNPTLANNEIGFTTDTNVIKYGNGTTAWNSLAATSASALPNYKVF
jgi:hypothetical protein